MISKAIGFLAAVGIAGCGSDLDLTEEQESDSRSAKRAEELRLVGIWDTDCYKQQFHEWTYVRDEMRFVVGKKFEKKIVHHNDANCKKEVLTRTIEGTFEVRDPVKKQPRTRKINFTVEKFVIEAHTSQAATVLNDAKYCGRVDWKKGKDRTVTGLDCDGIVLKGDDVIHDLYERDGKRLYFGDELSLVDSRFALDSHERPDKVNSRRTYVRK